MTEDDKVLAEFAELEAKEQEIKAEKRKIARRKNAVLRRRIADLEKELALPPLKAYYAWERGQERKHILGQLAKAMASGRLKMATDD